MQSAKEKENVEGRDWNVLNIVEVFVFTIVSFFANRIAVARDISIHIVWFFMMVFLCFFFVCFFRFVWFLFLVTFFPQGFFSTNLLVLLE
ncbi:hypothetical protein EUTSA_v10019862mg [Eutrema salsugineum]|uniref:Transmembrane protein n=1 Tax=Eutrema salsugineum TaxID=72664 RepID=V4K980_EUTSA|nr:hypothetical protein EUTSA_v10019862mg [Eutrema salsugineum]